VRGALLPLLAIAAGLLLAAGAAKLRAPAKTQEALGALGLPSRAWLARALGGMEAGVGAAVLVVPGRDATAALASLYLMLTIVVAAAWLRGERDVPCGCFGGSDASADPGHLGVNLACLGVAAAALVLPPASLTEALTGGPLLAAIALSAGVACAVYLLLALLSLLPDSWRAYQAARGDGAL
jgi:methylamine utilization protein MauE